MHKVSRTLLTLGVLAFGTLTAACGDKLTITEVAPVTGVQSVTVSPPSATIGVNQSIQLVASVIADAATPKTVTWTSSNAAIATVDATGRVTAPATSQGGTVTIIATSTADATKQGAAAIVVIAPTPVVPPAVSINSVVDNFGNPVNLSAAAGQMNVTVNVSNTAGASRIEVFLSTNCTTNTISANDVAAATQDLTAGQNGPVTLSINTAALTAANAPRFANGNYCIKARLTTGIGSATPTTVVATNTTPITLANTNQFAATVSFTNSPRKAGSPVSAVSSLNGLNYNSGNMTVTLNPVIFTSSNPVALISGYLTQNGEMANGFPAPANPISFTNSTVTNGAATITFTDTSATGVRSIFLYNSLPAGDTLYITSATDAAGNPIAVTPTPGRPAFAVGGAIRIDNDNPNLAAYVVNAPNGYIPAGYAFSSGTTGTATDVKAVATAPGGAGIQGVGGVTTTYYVGAAGSAAFATANSCNITGLTAAASSNDLANTNTINANQAKVVVKDALGNMVCTDVASTYAGGLFGVDKIAPEASWITSTVNGLVGVAANAGTNLTNRGFNTTFRDSISGFPQALGSSPYTGTLKRNFYQTPSQNDCVVGNFNTTTLVCQDTVINTSTVPSFFEVTTPGSTFINSSFQITNGTNAVGYYTATLVTRDVAGNLGPTLTRTAAFDNVAPGTGGVLPGSPTQAGAAVPLGSATISQGATDDLNLMTSRGNLIYALAAPITFARQAGNTLGTFGEFNRTATATVSLPMVYRGMQDASTGTISPTIVTPTATITVTDVGGNASTSQTPVSISTTTAAAGVPVLNRSISLASSAANGTGGTSVATTNLTFQANGLSSDASFQSQPYAAVDIYKLNTTTNEWEFVQTLTAATVTDNTTTGARSFSWVASGVALSPAPTTAGTTTNSFIAIARTGAGDAVRSPTATQTNTR